MLAVQSLCSTSARPARLAGPRQRTCASPAVRRGLAGQGLRTPPPAAFPPAPRVARRAPLPTQAACSSYSSLPEPLAGPSSSGSSSSFWAPARRAAGALALAAAVALSSAAPAWAARSGGRMGGSSFGSYARSAGSSYGASASYGGSGGSWGSRSSYGSSYSSLGSGLSSGRMPSYSRGSSVAVNSFFLSPWGFGGYGMGYPMGGGGFMSLLFWGAFAVIALQVFSGLFGGGFGGQQDDYDDDFVTVAKLQVGLLGGARELQRDLERIAARADTSDSSGLHYILQETVLSLLRNPDYCVYGFAKSRAEPSAEDAEQKFNELSLAERGKFQAETLSNVGGRTKRASLAGAYGGAGGLGGDREYIVITLLVAAEGPLKLPKVTSRETLTSALAKLGAVRERDLLAVEVLWTPEEEGDFFTQEDLAMDYPTLNTL